MSSPLVLNFLKLAVVVLACGALLAGAVVWLMARALLRPPRMTDGKAAWVLKRLSPGDLGLHYEEAAFDVRDERTGEPVRIKGWWIPSGHEASSARGRDAASDRSVVLLHGYADAKVGAIAWAPVWHAVGFNILAIDLRAHGESDGTDSTAGYFERHDVAQVINQLRAERPGETRQLVLFGVSLGAGVAAAVAAVGDEANATESTAPRGVDALVLESPFTDFRAAAMTHMDALGLPGGVFQRAALRLAEWLSGARLDDVRPVDTLRSVRCPVLVIAPLDDLFRSPAETAAIEAAVAGRPKGSGVGRVWQVDDADHLMAVHADPDGFRANLESFIADALPTSHALESPAAEVAAVPPVIP